MKGNSFGYLCKQGVSGLWKNRMMTLASIGVLTACLLIVGFAVLLTENINQIVGYVESQNEIVAWMYKTGEEEEMIPSVDDVEAVNIQTALEIKEDFMQSGMTETAFRSYLIEYGNTEQDLTVLFGDQSIAEYEAPTELSAAVSGTPVIYWGSLVKEVEEAILSVNNIDSVKLVPREEGLQEYKQKRFGDLSYLLDNYEGEDNPVAHYFVIKLVDLKDLEETAADVEAIQGVKLVNAATSVASTLVSLRTIINIVGWAIVLALSAVSLVIIVNTIRASIFTRRKEINIMKYVGATNAFIRIPFLIEGFCLGIISAVISFFIIWAGYSTLLDSFLDSSSAWIQSAFQQTIPFEQISLKLILFFVVAGSGLGVLGSSLSIRNHIKV